MSTLDSLRLLPGLDNRESGAWKDSKTDDNARAVGFVFASRRNVATCSKPSNAIKFVLKTKTPLDQFPEVQLAINFIKFSM